MNSSKPGLPWLFLALDIVGMVLLVVGILALTGVDFGHPVLKTVAPGFIALGLLLMVPIAVWAIRRGRA
ncbi:MAG: hypothetical protein HKO64_00335 [Xanthomonadales bacterium]|nr:hypothetical protein [Gammaproteobacteria bacterium]NNE06291.1 hypothetical protein [Xanthomonadales bacterium]NNL94042.1 hypothetical protein [Xanthomonadales bacterium]